ncbi:MAG: PAS/PAC sensor-containing diguanylate cyclase [Gallionellaceae bacterium]|nr:MAG: PAS/PAC sensor-containing diguanylate cyclase [Gallionellaceae bacterium]
MLKPVQAINQIPNSSAPPFSNEKFTLLRRFSITSMAAMLLTAFILVSLYRQDQFVEHEEIAAHQSEKTALHINHLLDAQLKNSGIATNGFDAQDLRMKLNSNVLSAAPGNIPEHRFVKLKIYDLSGVTLYSSINEEIGKPQYSVGLAKALQGNMMSQVEFRNSLPSAAGTLHDRYISVLYMPLTHDGKQTGVIEINADVTPIMGRINAKTISIALIVFGSFCTLYVALFFSVRRTDRAVVTWQRSIRDALKELKYQKFALDQHAIVGTADVQGTITYANNQFAEISGYAIEELIGQNHRLLKSGVQSTEFFREMYRTIAAGKVWHGEICNKAKDGHLYWVATTIVPYMDENGKPTQYISMRTDITARKLADEHLRVAAAAFETHEAIMITDANAKIIRVNQAFQDITGYKSEEVLGKNPRTLSSGRHDKTFFIGLWQHLLMYGFWSGEIWDRRKNGEIYPKELTITAVKDDTGKTTEYVSLFSDITARKQAEEEISNLAFYDALTGLPNRRLLHDRLSQSLSANKRKGCYGAVIYLDLDNFKPLNDTHGHMAGDLLLIEAANRLISCIREMDTVARIGGDEFVVMLSELDTDKTTSTAQAGIVAEKIRATLNQPYLLHIKQEGEADVCIEHLCTASIGVIVFNDCDGGQSKIIKLADAAMYQAKEAGRNQIRFGDGNS